jgi:hypothetical protein
MRAFHNEARVLVEAHETTIRKVATEMNRRNKLSGEKVTQLMEKHGWTGRPLKARRGRNPQIAGYGTIFRGEG